jgi:hypothetical protein
MTGIAQPFRVSLVPLSGGLVAYRPRFGGDSQARTPQLAGTSWRGSAGQGPAIRTRQVLD